MDNDDLLEFAESVSDWHQYKVNNLNDVISNIKEGVLLQVGTDGEKVELNAEQAKFFKAGLEVALGEFEELPFRFDKTASDDVT